MNNCRGVIIVDYSKYYPRILEKVKYKNKPMET